MLPYGELTAPISVQAFFAEIYQEAKRATPGEGHRALAAIEQSGKLQRHYTLNVDGLAAAVGLSTWHPTINPQGQTSHRRLDRQCTLLSMQSDSSHLLCGTAKRDGISPYLDSH
jgi:NAD-dependent SIR2 family protein deacetylase